MTVSSENAASGPLRRSGKARPAGELALAVLFEPLAALVVRALLPLRIPAPSVVLANASAGILAVVASAREELVLAALLLQVKTLLDNVDGRLARASNRVTLLGRFLDTEADLVVNAALFAALGSITGQPWPALAAFVALTLVLSVDFNEAELYGEVRGEASEPPARSGGIVERVLELCYRAIFAPQDRLVRGVSARRLERALAGEADPERIRAATLAYYDRFTVVVLANLGLSTQLLVLGLCLVLGVPAAYLWLVAGSVVLLPVLQLRRERLARLALRR